MTNFDPEHIATLAELDQLVMDIDKKIDYLADKIADERADGIEEHQILKNAMYEIYNMEEHLPRHVLCVLIVLAVRRLPEARPPMPEWNLHDQDL